ncbi:MAG: DUF3379 family protein [Candidatus Competibacterales bacterium]
MNCLDFRRRLLINPGDQHTDFLRHRRRCPDCAREVKRVEHLEQRLRAALQLEVPEGLSSRLILNQPFETPLRPRRWLRWLAPLLLVALLALIWGLGTRGQASAASRLQEVLHQRLERGLLMATPGPGIDHTSLRRALMTLGLDLRGPLGDVRRALAIELQHHSGLQLTLTGQRGPVLVLLFPALAIPQQLPLETGIWRGALLPVGRGSMAVVGRRDEPLKPLIQHLNRQLLWL